MSEGVNLFNPPIGTLRVGAIVDTNDFAKGKIKVKLRNAPYHQPPVPVYIPQNLALNSGLFMGAKPDIGTPVVLGVDNANQHYFVSYYIEDVSVLPNLNDNEILISANSKTKMTFNKVKSDIYLGSETNKVHINTESNLITSRFSDEHHFTKASRKFDGLVKRENRDGQEKTQFDLNKKIDNDNYDVNYKLITLDPASSYSFQKAGDIPKNPAFVESREIIYEFQYDSDIKDDITESSLYKSSSSYQSAGYAYTNRRKSKADTLSLTLLSPNYLIETVKGTVVDIFGNILDLNRFPLPVGKDKNTFTSENSEKSFFQIKSLERRSLAYHFEINARKDFDTTQGDLSKLFGFDDKFPDANYGRMRSRFFLDIDKEGQIKLNVPASSEKGNIPLLTRYENFTNLAPEDNNNPDKLIYREDRLDILHDSFACPQIDTSDGATAQNYKDTPGSITIKDGDAVIPIKDRRYKDDTIHLKHGMAYHDIFSTCYLNQTNKFLEQYVADKSLIPELFPSDFELLKDVVKDTVTIGENAGGRSGSLNFDGSIELNIGANTSDRQSLWLDTAGGIVGNIGRDLNNRSAMLSMNGHVFIEIGGKGVKGDSRFKLSNDAFMGGILDIRIWNGDLNATMIRVDKNGVTLMTPGNLNIHSKGQIKMSSKSLEIDADHCKILGREVKKGFGGSI